MIPKLEVSHLCYSYHTMEGETEALSNLSFQVQTGEFLAVVGPSGCGKSTLLSLICGLLKPDSGRILLDGQPVLEGDTRIGYMLQKDHLFEWRTIRSNACLGLGYLIMYGSQVFKLDLVLMSIVILCILAAFMYQGIALAERRAER